MIRSTSDNEGSLFDMLAEAVAEGDDLEALARPLLKILSTMTGVESTCLTRVDVQQNVQATLFACNAGEIDLREGVEIPWNESLCQRAMSEGRPFIQDVASHWGDSAMVRETSIATYLSMPVCAANGELFGTLCGVGGTNVALGSGAQRTLSLFTDMIARQVDRERLIRRLQRENRSYASEALLDPLTGIPNRRALLRELPRMLRLAERFGHTLHVAMIDLDDFKRINDTHGHDTGDRCLIEVAHRLADGVRDSDYVARHGGDEFVVLGGAGGTAPEVSAERFAETLNELIRGRAGPGHNALAYPGASVGVITVDPGKASPQRILARADQAMYRVKKQRAADFANDGDARRVTSRSSRSSGSADK